MKKDIETWSEFIKETKDFDFELISYKKDESHSQKFMPGKWHIYSFWVKENNEALKIGIAGPNSAARFTSQHYNKSSSNSNLAKSLEDENMCGSNAKEWIKSNTYRINVVFDDFSKPLAHALETHLHLLHDPRFEK